MDKVCLCVCDGWGGGALKTEAKYKKFSGQRGLTVARKHAEERGNRKGGKEQERRRRYKKPVVSACAAPSHPPPRVWCDGVKMKERLWRRSDPSLAPSKEEERDQSRGPWHSKRCQDTHTVFFTSRTWLLLKVLPKVTLQSILFCFEHCFLELTASFLHILLTTLTKLLCHLYLLPLLLDGD